MNDLLQSIATMPGPSFLLLYLAVVAATLLVCWLTVRRLDTTVTAALPSIPAEPDPLEMAYLRGGSRELTRLLAIELVERRFLGVADDKNRQLKQTRALVALPALTPLHQRVFHWFANGRKVREALAKGGVHKEVEQLASQYRQRLERDELLTHRQAHRVARTIALVVLAVLGTLAAYKLSVALPADRPSTFLVFGAVAAIMLTFRACRLPRLSRRGRAFLGRIQLAYAKLQIPASRPPIGQVEPLLLLSVGLFGIGPLSETVYASYTQIFPQVASSGWSLGGDGEDGCGGCSGCGGCGGCG